MARSQHLEQDGTLSRSKE
ncbi:uncharacterized, partial [Tachysurus ichikawai]